MPFGILWHACGLESTTSLLASFNIPYVQAFSILTTPKNPNPNTIPPSTPSKTCSTAATQSRKSNSSITREEIPAPKCIGQ